MGFLGISADITGFSIDTPYLAAAIFAATFLQFMNNEAKKHNKNDIKEK